MCPKFFVRHRFSGLLFRCFGLINEFIFELIQGQRPLAPEDHRWIPFIVHGFVSQLPAEFLSEGRRPVAAT